MMSDKSLYQFSEDRAPVPRRRAGDFWYVLSVEDDLDYQRTLALSLSNLIVLDKPVKVICANSAAEAAKFLAERDDISVILLDVVMEEDESGLMLANSIRNVFGDDRVRIVLLTGQPGIAPRSTTMDAYDINEYWNKIELTESKLRTSVASNIKTWQSLNELYIARRGLQVIVDASRSITAKQDINEFAHTVLEEVGQVIGIPESGGIVCVYRGGSDNFNDYPILAKSGEFSYSRTDSLKEILSLEAEDNQQLIEYVKRSLEERRHFFFANWSILCFVPDKHLDANYLFLVKSPTPLEASHIALLTVFSENISNGFTQIALMNKLTSLAYYDSELNIPNHHWLTRELRHMTRVEWQYNSLLLFRVQNYSEMVISLGRTFTFSLLMSFVKHLKVVLPDAYNLTRLDDDLFAALIPTGMLPDEHGLADITSQTLSVDGREHQLVLKLGIAPLNDIADAANEQLLTIAEMSLMKSADRGELVTIFDPHALHDVSERYNMLTQLYQAIAQDDALFLMFQPKLNLISGEIVGAEALLRWQCGEVLIPPDRFIPLAETSGLMNKIDIVVMKQTFSAIKQLNELGIQLPVSFNVTYSDVISPVFLQNLQTQLSETQVSPALVEIEITESQAMEDYRFINPILQQLIDQGMRVSIDDFGTGYSSLSHITNLAATTLKVDRSFVMNLQSNTDNSDRDVIEMVKRLADRFDFDVVAEGIETQEQLDVLLEYGYTTGQGYYLARPMTLPALVEWIAKRYSRQA